MIQIFVLLLGTPQRSWCNYVMQNSMSLLVTQAYWQVVKILSQCHLLPISESLKPFRKLTMDSFFDIVKLYGLTQSLHHINTWLNCYRHQLCTQPNSCDWNKGYNFNTYVLVSNITLSSMKMFGITIFKCINTSNTKMSLFIQCTMMNIE
jgi:hypothetical protein